MGSIIIQIYEEKKLDCKTLEELDKLKKMSILQVYKLDGLIAVSRWATAVMTLRREIKSYQIYHSTTA